MISSLSPSSNEKMTYIEITSTSEKKGTKINEVANQSFAVESIDTESYIKSVFVNQFGSKRAFVSIKLNSDSDPVYIKAANLAKAFNVEEKKILKLEKENQLNLLVATHNRLTLINECLVWLEDLKENPIWGTVLRSDPDFVNELKRQEQEALEEFLDLLQNASEHDDLAQIKAAIGEIIQHRSDSVQTITKLSEAESASKIQGNFRKFRFKKIVDIAAAKKKNLEKGFEFNIYNVSSSTSNEELLYIVEQFKMWKQTTRDSLNTIGGDLQKNLARSPSQRLDRSRSIKQLQRNDHINNLIIDTLLKVISDRKTADQSLIRAIFDKKGQMQSVMVLKFGESRFDSTGNAIDIGLHISYLASASWNQNINATAGDSRKKKGAAIAAIKNTYDEMLAKGARCISLESLPNPETADFYKSLGFKCVNWVPSESSLIPMELSREDAQKLFEIEKHETRQAAPIESTDIYKNTSSAVDYNPSS